ncbi:MAG: glycosyl hydrolase family 79 C-terminal domain-containing protein [Solirubrobacteraceae bacterium]
MSLFAAQGASAGVVRATVSMREVGRIPFGFLGLSLEIRGVENYAGFNPGAINPVFEQLIRNLDPGQRPRLRLGGDTLDWTWAPIAHTRRPVGVRYSLTPTWFKVVKALAQDVDARLIVGVNLEVNRARVAAAEARAIVAGIGSPWLEALELGNEPELYNVLPWFEVHSVPYYGRPAGWGFSDYLNEYASISRTLPRFPLAGPDIASAAWLGGLGSFLTGEPRVRIATVHRYPLGCLPSQPATIAQLLSPGSTRDFAAGLGSALATAHAHGIPLRVDEMGAVSCGGQAGVSDTFATALWALDVQFELARAGLDGVNIHTRVALVNQLFSFRRVHRVWEGHIAPEYYGLLAFAQAAPAGSRLLRVLGVPDGPVRVWATGGPERTERVVLINLDTQIGTTVAVQAGSRHEPATLERLTAPRAGARSGVRLGGQSFGKETSTGTLAGRPRTASLSRSQTGAYRVWMPPASAAILTLTPRRR